MPKAKPRDTTPATPGLDQDEIADFVHELESVDDQASVGGDGVAAQSGEPPPLSGKKITVRQERGKKQAKLIPINDAAQQLDDVWHDRAPTARTAPEMRAMKKSSGRHWPWNWTLGILSLLAAVTIGGFFFFNRAERFSGTRVTLQVIPTAEVASGNDVTVTVRYQNQEPVDLVKSELTIEYPDGFTFRNGTPDPTNDFKNAFSVGTIKSGRAGEVKITGTLIGSINTERTFRATLTYRTANFNSDFQATADGMAKITSSILGLKINGPTAAAPGATVSWDIVYQNTSDRDVTKIQIEAEYPDGVTVTKTEPAALERQALWQIENIDKQAEGKITITATVTGEIGDTFPLVVRAGLVTATNTIDLQDEQTLLLILIKTGVTLSGSVNGAADGGAILPGDQLNYSLRVANDSETEVADLTVSVVMAGSALDLVTIPAETKKYLHDKTLTWTKKEVPGLALLKPNQDLIIRWSLNTLTAVSVVTDSETQQTITATAGAVSPSLELAAPPALITSKVTTVMGFKAEGRYANDDGVLYGSGPIPPKVGLTTSYRIFWTMTNTTNQADGLKVTTTLPTSVFWTGQNVGREAGDIAFDPTTRTVTWSLNRLPAGTGSRLPALTAYFEVSITPTADQVGSLAVLTDQASAIATDAFTAAKLAVTQPALTSDVPTDPTAGGEGTIVAP